MKQNYNQYNFNFHSAILALFFLLCLVAYESPAQVTITESFDGTQFPPNGWQQIPIYGLNATNLFDRVTTSTLPTCNTPQGGGVAFVRYRSRTALPPSASCLVSKRLDMSGRATCNAATTVSFWMWRDNTFLAQHDTVKVYIDTANNYFSNTKVRLHNTTGIANDSLLTRPNSDAPVATANTWVQYTYNLPAGRCTDHEYIMIVTGSAGGGNTYIDNFSVVTWPQVQTFQTTGIYYQETTPVSKGNTNQVIIGVNIQMNNAGNPALSLDSISLNTNGTSNLADIQNARLWYTGGSNIFYNVYQYGITIANPSLTAPFPGNLTFKLTSVANGSLIIGQRYVVAGGAGGTITHNAVIYNNGNMFTAVNANYTTTGTGVVLPYYPMEVGNNYFWLTYDIPLSATAGNCADAEYSGCYLGETGVLNLASIITLPDCRIINNEYCNGTIPALFWGTSELSDFVRHVSLFGEGFTNASLPILNNALNTHGPMASPYFGGPAPMSAHPPDYEIFPAVPTKTCVLKQGTTYAAPAVDYTGPGLTIQADADVGFDPNYVNAWIDFNHDGDFMDPGEQLIPAPVPLGGLTTTRNQVVVPAAGGVSSPGFAGPAGSIVGPTRMRVRASEAIPSLDPCTGGLVEGETEDYIVTIMPNCQAGVKTWLGYTDDWNLPLNWCGGVPTINDIALVQFSASGTPAAAYHKPVIHNNVTATAQTIRLAAGDTLYADAEAGASLTIRDSLRINYNIPGNGHIKVISSYAGTATISNGNLSINITPFAATKKNQRMQIVFTQADFSSQGILAGNVIDELWFDIYSRATNPAFAGIYNGFTISYAYCTSGWNAWPASPPTALATAGAYTQIYTGNLNLNQAVPLGGLGAANATGTLKIPVSSFVYAGGDIVFNICYNNSAVAVASVLANDLVHQTVTTNALRTMFINSTNSTATSYGCVVNWALPAGNVASATMYRPNITFKYHKVFNKFPINIGTAAASVNGVTVLGASTGHFDNNNNGATLKDGFEAGRSVVTFGSNAANQNITGLKSTLFNDLTIDKAIGTVTQVRAATVDSFLTFNNGSLLLNSLILTENYGIAGAVTRTNGYMVSEDAAAAGKMSWNIGANSIGVNHIFPFGNLSGVYIPVSINPAADLGIVTIATYKTIWDNTPYPVPVTHVNNVSGSPNDGSLTVDRFWMLNKTGPAANNSTVNFSYDNNEAIAPNAITQNALVAQRWNNAGWEPGLGTSTFASPASSQNAPGINSNFNGPWTLTNLSNPLPIELLEFNAAAVNDRVKIWWKTASEKENDYFTVERTADLNKFDFISRQPTKGNGPVEHDYETYDLNPLNGLQYYRLKSTTVNNDISLSRLVPVHFAGKPIFDITATASLYEAGLLGIDYISDSNEPCDMVLYDITGQKVLSKINIETIAGINHLDLGVHLSHGVYIVSLANNKNIVNRKLIY